MDKLNNCNPIASGKYLDILKTKQDNFKEKKIYEYGYYSIKKEETIYKIKDLDRLKKGEKVKGSSCKNTSSLKNEKLIKFINKFDKNILQYEDDNYTNQNLCLIYQLILRKMNDKENIYFIRPSLYNL